LGLLQSDAGGITDDRNPGGDRQHFASHGIAHLTLRFLCRAGQEYKTVLRLQDLLRLHADYFQLITNFVRSLRPYLRSSATFEKLHTITRKIGDATSAR
jgi:hypothetical protein